MTVQNLIDTLKKVQDKNVEVMFYHSAVGYQHIDCVYYDKCYIDYSVVVIEDSSQSDNIIEPGCLIDCFSHK